MMTWSEIGGGQPGAIDSALVAFGHNFRRDLTCSCQGTQYRTQISVQTSNFGVKEDFHPVEALAFVRKIAVSPSFDPETDSLGLRAVAQVYAFRCYTCIKNNWIYEQIMRIPKGNTASFCLEDEGKCSVAEVDCILEELDEQVKSGSVIRKKNRKVALEQHYLKVFQPVKALTFIKIMTISPLVDEINVADALSTVAQVLAFRRYICLEDDWIYRETMRISGSTDEAEAISNSSFSEEEQSCSQAQEEKISDEDKENGEEVDCIEGEFVEQVKSGSVISETNRKMAFEPHYMKVFQPVKALTFIKRVAVSPLVDDLDVVDAIPTVAQVYTFRRYVFLEHDWIYRETMRLSVSSDEAEANIDCNFSEDEQTCSGVQEEEFSDEDEENSDSSSVAGFTRGIPDCIGEADSIKRQKSWDVKVCSTSTAEMDVDFLKGTPNCNCLSNDKRHKTKDVETCNSRNTEDFVGPFCRDFYLPRHNAGFNSDPESSKKPKREIVKISSKIRYMENVVEPVCRDVHLLTHSADFSSSTSESTKKGKRDEKTCSKIRDIVDVVAPLDSDFDPLRLDTDCNGESENNKRQKKDAKVCCSVGDMEDVADPVSGDVDLVTVPADCNNVSEISDKQNVDALCNTRKAEGRDIADTIRAISKHEKESQSKQRQEMEKMHLCSTSNGNNRDFADLNRDASMRNVTDSYSISNVDGRNADTLRDTHYCNRESHSNKRLKTCARDSVFPFQGGSAQTFHEGSSASAAGDRYRSKIASHVLNDPFDFKLCNEAGFDSKVVSLPDKISPKEIIAPLCEDRDCVSPSQSPVFHLSHGSINLHSSAEAATDISSKVLHKDKVHRSSYKGNGRHRIHGAVISRIFRQSKTSPYPLNMWYYSPLRKDSPAASCNGESKSLKTDAQTDQPRTLHMKFPKGCIPPSKEELVKKFRQFGPLDYLLTKVYFYTGSARVVFLNHSDAKAACNHARRKSISPGGAMVRYWLYDHELPRKTNHISASISSPTGSSVPILKSCLRVPDQLGKKVRRTDLHVRFQPTS